LPFSASIGMTETQVNEKKIDDGPLRLGGPLSFTQS
jgi:hypothetical protein